MFQKAKKLSRSKERLAIFLFLLPFILSFLAFFAFPAFYSLALSFTTYKGYGIAHFVGIRNYFNLLTYSTMWNCLENTFIYSFASFIPTMLISFLLAIVMRSKSIRKYQRIYKPIIFLPQICVVVAASLVFQVIFGNRVGVINQLLNTSIPFLTNLNLMKYPVITLIVWRHIPWYFIIFLSGLTTISEEIDDAASIDGSNAFQRLIYITIPIMKPIFMLAFVNYTINSLKLFTEPNLLLGGSSAPPLQVAPYLNLVTNNIYGGNFGMASALGWFLVLFILVITLFQLRLFRGDNS